MPRHRAPVVFTVALGLCSLACEPQEHIAPESPERSAQSARSVAAQASSDEDPGLRISAGKPPIVGDPLGLLSKQTLPAGQPEKRRDPKTLAPGALINRDAQPIAASELPRDPRALSRASTQVIERRASTTIRDVNMTDVRNAVLARPKPHVLFFYGAYCPACRKVMPRFVEAVRGYGGDAGISAVSLDDDRNDFAAYIPALGGVIEPLLLSRTPGELRARSEELGVTWNQAKPGGISIPYIAIFDARGRVVRQGGSAEVARLATTLREL